MSEQVMALGVNHIMKSVLQSEFEATLGDYETSLTGRQQSGSKRPSLTMSIKQVNKTIDDGVNEVKNYVEKKYKTKNAKPHFSRFGITHHKGYRMMTDQDERAKALELMIKAIADDGFGAEEYGTAFWTDIQTKFLDAVKAGKTTDRAVTGGVSMKNESRKTLQKAMKSLLNILEGNYPDTYKAVQRQWGFIKQK